MRMRWPLYVWVAATLPSCGGGAPASSTTPAKPEPASATPAPAPEPRWGEDYDPDADEYGGVAYGGLDYDGGGGGVVGGSVGGVVGGYVPPPPSPPNLDGRWLGACAPGVAKGEHRRATVDVKSGRWDLVVEVFKDATCSKRTHAIRTAGAIQWGAQSQVVADAWDATLTIDARTVTADDAKALKAVSKACQTKTKAKAGTPVDVLASGCAGLGIPAQAQCAAEHHVVSVGRLRLRLGAPPAGGDLCAPERRATALGEPLAFELPSTGVPECDAYLAAMDAMLQCPAMPAGVMEHDMLVQSIDAMKSGFSQLTDPAARQQAADGCRQAEQAVMQSKASFGCP